MKSQTQEEWPIPTWGVNAPAIRIEPPGPRAKEALRSNGLFASRSTTPHPGLVWSRARGAVVQDVDGNVYIDFSSGAVVANAGHCHPRISRAITLQAERLVNCYDFVHEAKAELVKKISDMTPGKFSKRVYLCTIGSEAVEHSVRLARVFNKAPEIVSFEGSFHGRATTVAASLCGEKRCRVNWGVLPGSVIVAPYGYCYRCAFEKTYPDCQLLCVRHLERVLETSASSVAAVITEPVQGAGGYVVPPRDYLLAVQDFCKRHALLFIVDEIQTGFGRTGAMFACNDFGIEPDLLVLGKGLSGGMPIAAVCGRGEVMDSIQPGQQSSTFGGNPLSCAAALASIDVLVEEKLPQNALKVGQTLLGIFRDMQQKHPLIGDVRGKGCAICLELVADRKSKEPATEAVRRIEELSMKKGLIVCRTGWWAQGLRVSPPLVITDEQARKGADILEDCISKVERS